MKLSERKEKRQRLLQQYDFSRLAGLENDPGVKRRFLGMAYLKQGETVYAAAEKVGVSWISVRNWLYLLEKMDIQGLRNRPKNGRKSKLKHDEVKKMHDEVIQFVREFHAKKRRLCSKHIQRQIEKKFNIYYSSSTVYKILKQLGLSLFPKELSH